MEGVDVLSRVINRVCALELLLPHPHPCQFYIVPFNLLAFRCHHPTTVVFAGVQN